MRQNGVALFNQVVRLDIRQIHPRTIRMRFSKQRFEARVVCDSDRRPEHLAVTMCLRCKLISRAFWEAH